MNTAPPYKIPYNSPVGPLLIEADGEAITALNFSNGPQPSAENTPAVDSSSPPPSLVRQAIRQLAQYFQGQRERFDLPLAPAGTTFQRSVWEALRDIPFGQTCSYGDLARQLGDPNKVRAVGAANGRNPISIIIPCHRVIGANKKLVGYAGGIERKKKLLQHEGALLL